MRDALHRRLRFDPPEPIGQRTDISESDLNIFEAIHRHGPLPTHYLFQFSGRDNFNSFQQRLTKLYNGAGDKTYLVRPPQQFASFHARYQHIVYDLNDRSRQLLHERGRLSPFIQRTDPFLHRLMGACVSSSLQLGLKEKYISRHDILQRTGSPMELPLSKQAIQKALVPDELFGINYGDSYRFFAVEIDRQTESIERKNPEQNTFGKKLANYLDVMKHRTYKEIWGVPTLMVLTVTTNVTHMKNMMSYLHKLDPKLSERFLFKALPTFGANWRVPPLLDMLEPWDCTQGSFDISLP